jgi:hypothetical protein
MYSNEFQKIDSAVLHNSANVMWQDNIEVTQYNEDIIMSELYCKELILNTYTNWRLPTIEELISINDIENKRFIKNDFKYVKKGKYISKSKYILNGDKIWYVDFKNGNISFDNSNKIYYIRCIRNTK